MKRPANPKKPAAVRPVFFAAPDDFRAWLAENHDSVTELWVGYYKVGTGRPSLTWPQSVDEALCAGWIDGVRKSIDAHRYMVRFTPRKPTSAWSAVNIKRMAELTAQGRVLPAGLAAFERRPKEKSGYSMAGREDARLDRAAERLFRANAAAWEFFQAQPPAQRRNAIWWVISAKREETRQKRLAVLIEKSARGEPVGVLARPEKAK